MVVDEELQTNTKVGSQCAVDFDNLNENFQEIFHFCNLKRKGGSESVKINI